MDWKILFVLLILVAFSVVGCSKQLKPDGFPPLYPASVLITQDGQPLKGAKVILFHTDDASQRWGIFGTTDGSGRAVFVTHGKFRGAPEGEYLVAVYKQEEVEVARRGDNIITEAFTLIEEQYTDREKSPLRIQIQRRGKNHGEFDVGKPVRVSLGREVA